MFKADWDYLHALVTDIFPNKRFNLSNYLTKNAQHYCISKRRIQVFKSSFVPTVIHDWNALPLDVRQIDSFRTFKEKNKRQ